MAQISKSQMVKLFHRLATSYAAGGNILTSFQNESNIGSSTHRAKMQEIATKLQAGQSLADSMQSVNYFPDLALAVVEAGETGGKMDESFRRLSLHYDGLVKFRNNFLMSISWPAFELLAAIVIIGLLILGLGMVASFTNSEPMITFGTGSATGAFLIYCAVVLLFSTAIGILFVGFKNGWFGTYPMEIARRIPLIGSTLQAMALSRFAWTMSVAENAGMSAVKTMQLAVKSTQNHYYEKHGSPMCDAIQQGQDFTSTMTQTSAFPQEFMHYVSNGEMAGELAESMDKASKDLQLTAENNLKLIGKIGMVLVMLLVGLVLAVTIIMMYQKLYIQPIQDLL